MTLLYMIIWTLYKRFTSSSVRMSNVSNTNYIKVCWLSDYVFHVCPFHLKHLWGCLSHGKTLVLNSASGKTSVKSTHACFLYPSDVVVWAYKYKQKISKGHRNTTKKEIGKIIITHPTYVHQSSPEKDLGSSSLDQER